MKEKTVERLIEWAMAEEKSGSHSAFKVGEKYFIRMVTHYMTGKLEEEVDGFLIFSNAACEVGLKKDRPTRSGPPFNQSQWRNRKR